jgi:hypothetical protein
LSKVLPPVHDNVTEKNHKAKLGPSGNPKNHRKTVNIVTFSVDKMLYKKYNCENMNK